MSVRATMSVSARHRRSREKGAEFEREVARAFRAVYPGARRGFQFRDGAEAPDVAEVGPWWVECKTGRAVRPVAALAQAEAAMQRERAQVPPGFSLGSVGAYVLPLAVCRERGRRAVAVLDFEDFLWLLVTLKLRAGHAGVAAPAEREARRAALGIFEQFRSPAVSDG